MNKGKRSARRGHPRWDHDRGRRSPRNTDTIKTNSQKNLLCDLAAANSGVPLHRKSLHSYYRISHVSIPTYHRTRESQTRSQTKTRRQQTDRPHTQGWRFAPRCHLAWASEGTLVGPGKDTQGTPVPLRRKAVGGPTDASRDHNDTTKGDQRCSGASSSNTHAVFNIWYEFGDHTTPSSWKTISRGEMFSRWHVESFPREAECTDVDVRISCCCWLFLSGYPSVGG